MNNAGVSRSYVRHDYHTLKYTAFQSLHSFVNEGIQCLFFHSLPRTMRPTPSTCYNGIEGRLIKLEIPAPKHKCCSLHHHSASIDIYLTHFYKLFTYGCYGYIMTDSPCLLLTSLFFNNIFC